MPFSQYLSLSFIVFVACLSINWRVHSSINLTYFKVHSKWIWKTYGFHIISDYIYFSIRFVVSAFCKRNETKKKVQFFNYECGGVSLASSQCYGCLICISNCSNIQNAEWIKRQVFENVGRPCVRRIEVLEQSQIEITYFVVSSFSSSGCLRRNRDSRQFLLFWPFSSIQTDLNQR